MLIRGAINGRKAFLFIRGTSALQKEANRFKGNGENVPIVSINHRVENIPVYGV